MHNIMLFIYLYCFNVHGSPHVVRRDGEPALQSARAMMKVTVLRPL